MKTMPVSIRLDEKAKEKLKKMAKLEHRTLSNLIQKIVLEWLANKDKK